MKQRNVCTEVHIDTLDAGTTKEHHTKQMGKLCNKGTEVRARIVAKGFSEPVTDMDNVFASTPIYSVLRLLLTLSLSNSWTVRIRRHFSSTSYTQQQQQTISTCIHQREFYNKEDGIVWKLNKAIYGLRSSRKAWQTNLADVLQQLGLQRSTADPSTFITRSSAAPTSWSTWMSYFYLKRRQQSNKIFEAIQQHLLLRTT